MNRPTVPNVIAPVVAEAAWPVDLVAPAARRCVICGCPEGGLYPKACCYDDDNLEAE